MPIVKSKFPSMTIVEMKNAGQKQEKWSDDDTKWKPTGPNYVRIRAVGEDEHSLVRMELPASIAKDFRIGGKIVVVKG